MAAISAKSPIVYRIHYGWRLINTGLSFALFGLGGILIATLLSAFFYLMPYKALTKQKIVRKVLSATFRLYVNFMRLCGLISYEVRGTQHLSVPGQIIVANHPSLLDVVFLISIIRNADCIVKETLRCNPFMRAPIRAAGYISNDDPQLITSCEASLVQGSELIIFAEGTRTHPDRGIRFQRGAAHIAISSRRDITPVVIECHPVHLQKGQKWYQIPPSPPHYIFTALPPVAIDGYLDENELQGCRARRLTASLENCFAGHLGR